MRVVAVVSILVACLCLGSRSSAQQEQELYERVIVERAARGVRTTKPLVIGTHYAVTSMMPAATVAAQSVLQSGGNAFDAVVAGQAVLGLVGPASNGIGGDAMLLVFDAREKKVWSINAEGTAPRLATIEWFRTHANGKIPVNEGLLAATVPGVVDAWFVLLSRWGTRSFGQLLAPAVDLAERGIPLTAAMARELNTRALAKYPTSRRVYQPGGRQWKEGELFKNPDIARTFRRMIAAEEQASGGGRQAGLKAARDFFYKGEIAREMARFSEENDGLLRYEDFAAYHAIVEEPVSFKYRGYMVHKNPSASQGPAELFALNILSGYDLGKLGHNSADYIHTLTEATKLAMADREKYLADSAFIKIPYAGLLSSEYAAERRKLIDSSRASPELRPGNAEKFQPGFAPVDRPVSPQTSGDGDHEGDTSYIAVVDRDRNAISFTPSLHSSYGTKVVMAELGFSLNCRGDYFSLQPEHANALAPGKRPRSTLQSTLVTRDGQLFLLTGCPGGDNQAINTMQTLLNIVDFGMNVQQAIEQPRWTSRAFPASPAPFTMYPGDLQVEARVAPGVRADLVRRGHKVYVRGAYSIGLNAAILSESATGVITAGADPRNAALAVAW
jgi:gamma-glutamyltranspeptidase / glutathione hydrolase